MITNITTIILCLLAVAINVAPLAGIIFALISGVAYVAVLLMAEFRKSPSS